VESGIGGGEDSEDSHWICNGELLEETEEIVNAVSVYNERNEMRLDFELEDE